jgi:hypothetical protein
MCSATSLTQHIRNERRGGVGFLTVERKDLIKMHDVSWLSLEGRYYLCTYSIRWVKPKSDVNIFCCRPQNGSPAMSVTDHSRQLSRT